MASRRVSVVRTISRDDILTGNSVHNDCVHGEQGVEYVRKGSHGGVARAMPRPQRNGDADKRHSRDARGREGRCEQITAYK